MSLAAKLREFKKNPSPREMHADRLGRTRESVLRSQKTLMEKAPATVTVVLPSGEKIEATWKSIDHFYWGCIRPMKEHFRNGALYFEYRPESEEVVLGDIFHRAEIAGAPVIFVCNTERSNGSRHEGLSRSIFTSAGNFEEVVVHCDNFIPLAEESLSFFREGISGAWYPPLKEGVVARQCNNSDEILQLAESIDADLPLRSKLILATGLSMEASEIKPDPWLMANLRALAMASHELGHMFYSRAQYEVGTDGSFSESAALAAEIAYGGMPATRLGEILPDARIDGNNARSVITGNFDYLITNTIGFPKIDETLVTMTYASLDQKVIVETAIRILNGICKRVFGRPWGEVASIPAFAQLREAIFNA